MRILSAALQAAQQSELVEGLVKAVLTLGADTQTFTDADRINKVKMKLSPYSHKATLVLDNTDHALDSLDLKGYQAVISFGCAISAGDEYSPQPPMKVIKPKYNSVPDDDVLTCELTLLGIPDLMKLDKAKVKYLPAAGDTNTVKDLLTALFGATMTGFTHCQASYDVVYDSEDSLIDTLCPQDKFRVFVGDDRMSKAKELIGYTKCQMRFRDDGKWHVFVPVTTTPAGETLRPNAAGDEENIENATSGAGNHWDDVNEATADGDTSIVQSASEIPAFQRDLYNLPSLTATSGIIKQITVTARCKKIGSAPASQIKVALKTGGTAYESDAANLTVGYANYTKTWATNPKTGLRWTITDINALQIGVSMSGVSNCTQNYVLIEYEEDYSLYSLAAGYHTFFAKAYQTALVIPGKVTVQSQEDDDPQYTGSATTANYESYPDDQKKEDIKQFRLASNAQAAEIAAALIAQAEMMAAMGSAVVPLNVGAEIWDYVKVVDSYQGDTRYGNTGSLNIEYAVPMGGKQGKWEMSFSFGDFDAVLSALEGLGVTSTELQNYFPRFSAKDGYIENIHADNCDFTWLDPDNTIDLSKIGDTLDSLPDGVTYVRGKSLHLDAAGLSMEDNTLYYIRFDPESAECPIFRGDTEPTSPATNTYWVNTNYSPPHVQLWTGAAWDTLDAEEVAELKRGVVYRRNKSSAMTAGGLTLLSQTSKDGKWYEESGVVLDADWGVAVYGVDTGFRTYASKDDYDDDYAQDFADETYVKCFIDTTGYIVVKGEGIKLKDSTGTYYGWLYVHTDGKLMISGGTSNIAKISGDLETQEVRPITDNGYKSGTSSYRWSEVHAVSIGTAADQAGGVFSSAFQTGTTPGITQNYSVTQPGGGTIILKFVNGLMIGYE